MKGRLKEVEEDESYPGKEGCAVKSQDQQTQKPWFGRSSGEIDITCLSHLPASVSAFAKRIFCSNCWKILRKGDHASLP